MKRIKGHLGKVQKRSKTFLEQQGRNLIGTPFSKQEDMAS